MKRQTVVDDVAAEPNLTSMLDLVMNILMFFIVCYNLQQETVKGEVALPKSDAITPIEKTSQDKVILNVRPWDDNVFRRMLGEKFERERADFISPPNKPCVVIFDSKLTQAGNTTMELRVLQLSELGIWLTNKYDALKRRSSGGKVNAVVILRADRSLKYADVFTVLQRCRAAGFRELKMRAVYSS